MSAAVTVSALAELESRAGASDTDRTAWLSARLAGVTATEVRDLYLGKLKRQDLIKKKLSGKIDAELTAPVIVWGREREPIIAEAARARYGVMPETRVFRAADDPRKLASPDGVGVNFDEELFVAEYKTSAKNIGTDTKAFADSGYLFQMMWTMRVTGARRCLYGHELRISNGDRGYEAGELRFEWVEYDEALAAELEKVAVEFLAELDKQRDGDGPVIDEELDTLAVNYLRGAATEKDGKALKESAYKEIWARVDAGEQVVHESALARVSFSPEDSEDRETTSVDTEAAEAAAPALYAEFDRAQREVSKAQEAIAEHEKKFQVTTGTTRVVTKKAVLRITQPKQKGMAA